MDSQIEESEMSRLQRENAAMKRQLRQLLQMMAEKHGVSDDPEPVAPQEGPTVRSAIDRWLDELALRRDLRPSSRTTYSNAALAIAAHVGDIQLSAWSVADTSALIDVVGEGAWCRKILWVLRSVIRRAKKWGWQVPDDEATAVKLAPLDEREVYLTAEETRVLITRCMHLLDTMEPGSNRFGVAGVLLCVATGGRISEVSKARREDIKLRKENGALEGSIRVPASRSKNKKVRVLPLAGVAAQVVSRLLEEHSSEWLLPSSGWKPNACIGRVTVTRQWRQLKADLGFAPEIRVHDLRHTYASLAIQNGAQLYHVQQALGHLEPRSTRRYAHLRLADAIAVSRVVASQIGGS